MMKAWFAVLPKKTGFTPTGTIPTLESPETFTCISDPLPGGWGGTPGCVDKTTACASLPGSPVGDGTGTINCRKVSLQPAARTMRTQTLASSHIALKLTFIQTPPVLPVERQNSELLQRI